MDKTPKKINILYLGLLAGLFIVIFLLINFIGPNKYMTKKIRATLGPTTVNLVMNGADPDTNSYQVSVIIQRAANTYPIATTRIKLSYPKDNFGTPTVTYTSPFSQSGAGGAGVDTTVGTVTLVADWPRDAATGELQAQTATSLMVAQIRFPLSTGKTKTGMFSFIEAELASSQTGATMSVEEHNSLTIGQGANPTPTTPAARGPGGESVSLNLKLKFQGITTQPVVNSMTVKVSLVSSTGTKVDSSGQFTANNSGVWSGTVGFNSVSSGNNYSLLVKGPRHVQKKVCVTSPSETTAGTYRCSTGTITIASSTNTFDLSGIMQMAGDLPVQDGIINSYDISLIQNNLNTSNQSIIAKADVNNDGRVDSQDFSLVMATLGMKTDEE